MNQQNDVIMNNPYKELSPYLESDASRFKGRTSEIEEMYESFDRNEYLVCHADSGEGKSSIIEAGLIPKMKSNCYYPIRIIFNSDKHFKNNSINYDDVICRIIDEEIVKFSENKSFVVNKVYPNRLTNSDEQELQEWEKELIENNAWLKLRYTRITIDNLLYTPVLIFDQFEEVFTNPFSQEWTDRFFAWLQELSTDLCPQRIVTKIEKHVGENVFPEISTHKYFKSIFSLRSEYVGKLDYWGMQRHYIPLLKNNRYLLRPLTIKGAKEVITGQEGYDGLNDVSDDIVELLRKLQKGKNCVESDSSDLPCIPALLLSIVCSRAYNMSTDERSEFIRSLNADNDDEKEAAIYSLIESFYEKAISECEIPSGDMAIIEDVLVNSEGNRQRVSSHADSLKSIGFSDQYLKKLDKARLIRVIPEYNREEESIELVHDALCPVILKKKEMRFEDALKKHEEHRVWEQKRKMRKLLWVTFFTIIVSFAVVSIVLYQKHKVEEANKNLMIMRGRVVSEKALQILHEGNASMAANLMLEILPVENNKLPYLPEYESVIYEIYDTLIHSKWVPIETKGHYGEIMCSVFSSDGNLLVTGSNDKTARVWNAQTGREYESLRMMHTTMVNNIAISPDNKHIVTQTLYSDSLFLWNINGKKARQKCFIGLGESPCFFDNRSIGFKHVKKDEKYNLLIVDGFSFCNIYSNEIDSIVGYHSVYISNNKKNIVVITENTDTLNNKDVGYLMEVECPAGNTQFQIPNIHLIEAKFSPKNKYFAIRSNNRLDIIDLSDFSVCKTLLDDDLYDFVFSNDERFILYITLNNNNNTLRFWDINEGVVANTILFPWQINSLCVSSQDIVFGGGNNGIGRFWKNIEHSNEVTSNPTIYDCGDIRFFNNGDVFLIKENLIDKKMDNDSCFLFCRLSICNTEIFMNNKIVAVSTYDPSYRDGSSEHGSFITPMYDLNGNQLCLIPYQSLALANNNPWVITNEKEIFDYYNNRVVLSLKGHYNNLTCGSFMRNDSVAVTGSYDHTVRFWNVKTGVEVVEKRITLNEGVKNLTLNEKNGLIFICDEQNIIYVCDLEHGNVIKTIQLSGSCEYMLYDDTESILRCLVERIFVYPEWNGTYDILQYKIPSKNKVIDELLKYKYNLSLEERRKYCLE